MIFSFARSLDVNLVFEDRPYKLGEIINVTVEINARRDVKVRRVVFTLCTMCVGRHLTLSCNQLE